MVVATPAQNAVAAQNAVPCQLRCKRTTSGPVRCAGNQSAVLVANSIRDQAEDGLFSSSCRGLLAPAQVSPPEDVANQGLCRAGARDVGAGDAAARPRCKQTQHPACSLSKFFKPMLSAISAPYQQYLQCLSGASEQAAPLAAAVHIPLSRGDYESRF